jgi:hypothetical protein
MLHDERNKLCQRNILTDIVTTKDFVMKQVGDNFVVQYYIYLYFVLTLMVYGRFSFLVIQMT